MTKKDIRKRNKTIAEKERAIIEISKLYFQGISPYDMKPDLMKSGIDLSVPTIYKYIAKMKDSWRESRFTKIDEIIFQELAKLDNQERELWEAWQRSKENEKSTQKHTKRVPVKKDGEIKPTIAEQNLNENEKLRDGNPKFQELLLQVHDRRMALIGKDKAVNIFVQNNIQNNSETTNVMGGGDYIIKVVE